MIKIFNDIVAIDWRDVLLYSAAYCKPAVC